ncbi:GNAT family N-acetyltransferase [Paenibacillus sp. FSL R5-0490]|uniref:GNAT family N-acetyltransferase n=1 Tax=Paenibacillus sp. FSL R5-0490 TaxID=1920424 RepID=UPI00096E1B53|nr:N-acetyltransferase [Paenibacillus sp. FSL R5-0490]OMF56795.1 GNAT family N-acetyltransferase [Paenibacillus sp. FSL R5-0490]
MDILIRQELPADYDSTEEMVKEAFSHEDYSDKNEHFLVKRLRNSDVFIPELSLVALTQSKEIVGHILLSKIKISDGEKAGDSLALAPLSVRPGYQGKGIGSQLIRTALNKAKEIGYHSVIVLGHKNYYPKFGFKPASLWNIHAPFEVPDEIFMALELTENALKNAAGVVHYSKAFSE